MRKLLLLPFIFTLVFSCSLNAGKTLSDRKIRAITREAIKQTYYQEDSTFDFDSWRDKPHPNTKKLIKPILEKWARNFIADKTEDELNIFLNTIKEKRPFNYIEEVVLNKVFCEREFEQTKELKFLISAPELDFKDSCPWLQHRNKKISFNVFISNKIKAIQEHKEFTLDIKKYSQLRHYFTKNSLELVFEILKITDSTKLIETIDIRRDKTLTEIPSNIDFCVNTTKLTIGDNEKLRHLPQSLGNLEKLSEFFMFKCEGIEEIPNSICYLQKITELSLTEIRKFPRNISALINNLPNSKISLHASKRWYR